VVDRSGVGAGARVADGLAADGFKVTSRSYASSPAQPSETVVHYQPGDLPAADRVMDALTGAAILSADPQVPASTVVVDVGSVVAASAGAAAVSSVAGSPTTGGPAPAAVPTPDGAQITPSAAPLDFFDPRGC
jgi:hypothetical protein